MQAQPMFIGLGPLLPWLYLESPEEGTDRPAISARDPFFFLSPSKAHSFSPFCRKWPETCVHSPYGDWVSDVAL